MQTNMEFTCFSLNPIELAPCGNAVSTNRAGGVGVLDLEFCLDNQLDLAQENLDKFRVSRSAFFSLRT